MGLCEGRVAIVTGASRGIGVAIAERLAAEGASVAVAARTLEPHPRLPGTLRETIAAIEKRGGRALAVQTDLLDAASRARLVQETEAELGPIDILVNNAAAAFYMPFERYSEKRFRVAFEVNLRAPFELAQLVLPGMRERKRGWILNISSATSKLPQGPPFEAWQKQGGDLLYATTKAALNRFTAGLAAEVCDEGIAVNSLAPVAAVMTPGAEAQGVIPEGTPFEPVEVMAEAALVLCSCDPQQLNGRIAYSGPLLEELGRRRA